MKKLIMYSIKALVLVTFLLSYTNANAQVGAFNITVENVTQTATNKLEFDVYLLDTDAGQSFELASCQLGFLINSNITGGTLSVTINNSGSGLNGAQQFTATPGVVATLTGYPNQSLIRLAAGSPVSPGGGTIISTSGHGTLMTHFIVTSSVNFTANTTPDLAFTSNTATAPLYATRVAEFISLASTQLTVTPGVNALVNGNPVLNPLVAPTPFTVTGGGSYCQGSSGLPVGLSDSEIGVTYTLIRNGVDQSPTVAGTGSAFSFGSNFPGTYTYTVRGTNGSGTTPMANSVTITENPALPASVSIGASVNPVCAGNSVNFTATPTNGGSSPSYQWKVNGANVGTNSPNYSYVPSNNNTIACVMTSNATCATGSPATSNTITMTVNSSLTASVSIVASVNPVCAGNSVNFSATPTNGGSTPAYQWKVNGTNVGTNNPNYSYVPANNDAITCVMSSNATCVTGSPATSNTINMTVNSNLVVNVSIVASVNPVCAGNSVNFTATPTNGGSSPSYQWKVNGANVGTNSPNYSYIPVNNDVVTCVLSSNLSCATGSPATSNNITMTVNPNLAASVSIVASVNPVCAGNSVNFTATPTNGGSSPSYQWKVNGANVGTNSPNYSYVPANNNTVACVMTSNATCATGSPATSNTITMVVNSTVAASVSIGASANPVCSGTSVTITPTPVGGGTTPTYQWFKNSIAVATGSTYSYVPVNGDAVYVVMTSNSTCATGSPATSNTITMVVNSTVAASVSIGASANPVCSGTSVTITPTPVGGGTTPTYQWFKNSVAVGTGVTYSYFPVNGDLVYVVMTSNATCATGSPATSNTIAMVVNPTVAASVSIGASANLVCSGTSVTFTPAPVNGGTTPTYQWFKNSVAVATGSTYSYVPVNGDAIHVVMTSNATCVTGSPATSNTITMVVNSTVVASVSIGVSANPVCSGTSVTFTPTPVGGGTTPTYQWFKNSVAVASGTTYSYVPVNGDAVYVVMTSNSTCATGNPATSNTITLTVNPIPPAPTISTITQPTCAVATGSVLLTGLPAGNWTINPGAIAGSTTTYTIPGLVAGTYSYTVTTAAGCTSLASANVVINAQPPTPVVNNQTASILSGGIFTVTPSGGTIPVGTTYTWPVPTYTGGVTGGVAQLTPLLNITGTLTIPSGVGTAIYTVTPTSGTCIGATFTVTVTVTSTCTAVLVGTQPANSSMCAAAGPVTFTVTATGTAPFTYQWQYNNGVTWGSVANGTPVGAVYTNATTSLLSVTGISTAGSYQYRCLVTNCSGGNSIFSNPATLTVNALPIPTLTSSDPDNVFCFGTSVIFTAGGGVNYNFMVNGTTVQNGALTTYTTTSLANGQIVTVVVTGVNGCTATSTQIQNIVNPLPFIILSTSATCSTDFTTYSVGVTVGSGTVTSPLGTVTNNGGNIWTISGIPAHTNVSIKVTDSGGCENTLIVTAPVDCTCPVVLPPVSGGNRSYCAGGTILALTATVLAGETIDWYDSSSGGNILLPGSLSYTPSAAGTYYALGRKIGASSCVSSTRTPVILTMNPLPIPTLTSSDADNIFCGGTSVTFTAGGGTSYNFLVGGLSVQNGVSATYTTSTFTNGQSVVVIVTNASGCAATSAAITNTVNPTPVPTLTSSDADNSFCTGTNVTFTAGGGTNYNFRVEGVSVQNGVLTTYSTNSLTNGQVVDVVVSNTYGCIATSAGITNSVFAAPTPNAGTGGNNCGLGFSLNGSLNVGIGTWSKVSGPGSVSFSPDANTPTAIVTVSSFGTYVFSWTVANGTCISSANVTVVFIQQPPAEAGPGGDECDKDFIMKAVITTGVGTWTKISGPGTPVFTPDNHQANAKVTVDQFGTYNFGWTVVNSICTSSDVVRVVFHDLPPVNAGRDTAFCKGGSMQLLAQGVGTVSWVPVVRVSNPNIINPVATPDTTTTFTVNLTDQFGCKNSDNIVVEVRVKPIANAGPDQELTYVLKTTMNATLAHSYETGVWSVIPKSGTGEFLDSTNSKTLVSKLSLGKNKFLWNVKNGYCPSSSDTVMITVNDFIIPTLITPNMDGRNDYFVLRGLATLGKTELIIFDRRGTQVYRNINYDNSWNGVDYNKNPLPSDTYFYVIKSENSISISGYIVIRR